MSLLGMCIKKSPGRVFSFGHVGTPSKVELCNSQVRESSRGTMAAMQQKHEEILASVAKKT